MKRNCRPSRTCAAPRYCLALALVFTACFASYAQKTHRFLNNQQNIEEGHRGYVTMLRIGKDKEYPGVHTGPPQQT